MNFKLKKNHPKSIKTAHDTTTRYVRKDMDPLLFKVWDETGENNVVEQAMTRSPFVLNQE